MKPMLVASWASHSTEYSISRDQAAEVLWLYRRYRKPESWFHKRYDLKIGTVTLTIRHL